MKKTICLLLTFALSVALVACGEKEPEGPKKPSLDAEQEVVNICCDYSDCSTISGFDTGTLNEYPIENGYKVVAKGSYFPIDDYGDLEDKMLFDIEFEATWDGESPWYDIDVTYQYIR